MTWPLSLAWPGDAVRSTFHVRPSASQLMRIRCPNCHEAVEIVEDTSFKDVDCPSCGSHFTVVGDDASTEAYRGKTRRLSHFELIEPLGTGAFGCRGL